MWLDCFMEVHSRLNCDWLHFACGSSSSVCDHLNMLWRCCTVTDVWSSACEVWFEWQAMVRTLGVSVDVLTAPSVCVFVCLTNPTNSKLTCMTSCLTSVFVACFRIKYQHMLYATKHTVTPYPWTSAASAGWMLAVPQILYYLTLLIILHLNMLQFLKFGVRFFFKE